jgi:PPK2 family polyphosphate:nucleotide phosphotransferase
VWRGGRFDGRLDRAGGADDAAAMPHAMDRYRISPDAGVDLDKHDPRDRSVFAGDKDAGRERLLELKRELQELQEALYAEGRHGLLVVLQAMDAGGKDGTVRSVIDGVNPQGVHVACFKAPTAPELAHDFLWRIHPHVPGNGEIAIFNRSHYEDVLIVRVHSLVPEERWRARYQHIVAFERMLADEGTVIRKFFLHISKDEQRERLQQRVDDPKKRWKLSVKDIEERRRWKEYMVAYGDAIAATSTAAAPWYVVPADRNWYRDLVIAEVLVDALKSMHIRLPEGEPGLSGLRVE